MTNRKTRSTGKDSIIVRLMMLFIAACCLATSLPVPAALAEENCMVCHKGIKLEGRHGSLPCLACHLHESGTIANPSLGSNRAVGCVACHRGHERIFDHAMATRRGERSFVERGFARVDSGFWDKNCSS